MPLSAGTRLGPYEIVAPIGAGGKPTVFLNSPATEREPMFSPDGRWLAYVSSETGREEVYVRPFPGPGGKSLISTEGGSFPTWSRKKGELFYALNGQIMVAPYTVEGDDKLRRIAPAATR